MAGLLLSPAVHPWEGGDDDFPDEQSGGKEGMDNW